MPSLESLGTDLLETTRRQRRTALVRPFVAAAGFFVVATAEWWWLTPVFMFLLFVAVVTVTHDVVHHSIGLTRRQTDWALFLFGALLFESGHAYRTTHHRHHEVFPGPDDPEGDPARMGALASVLHGPLFLVRLWRWAYDRRKGQPRERAWLRAEALWTCFGCALALGGWWHAPSLAVYALGAFVGSWVYPLLTVHLPHHDYGDTPLEQTSTLRGRIIPAIFLELTYHLEHHLYPKVPSHNLAELSRRLDPYLRAEGVVPRRVI
ncbi:MAG: fatty acid desaturase [Planctomycetes bacterium]|nr:fatty acid desaturase [Planctomycetota bacterium]